MEYKRRRIRFLTGLLLLVFCALFLPLSAAAEEIEGTYTYITSGVEKEKRQKENTFYYRDSFFQILDSKPETLFSLDLQLIRYLAQKCGIKTEIRLTEDFLPGAGEQDFREVIHPKRANTILEDNNLRKPYFQVFSQKYGFLPNLSVIDLLFNEGPDAFSYLKPPTEGNDCI